jgi:L-rhamnose-H+ transport protein
MQCRSLALNGSLHDDERRRRVSALEDQTVWASWCEELVLLSTGGTMGHQIGWGLILVCVGGMLNGSFAAPMKRLSGWRWENTWLVYALTGLVIFPWVIALVTIPHAGAVLQQTSGSVLVRVALFGFAWGIGAVLFGQGIARVGLALGFAVILGISSSFGSLLPLVILHPDQLGTRQGLALIAGTLVMMVGLVFLAMAGTRRERDQSAGAATSERAGFGLGLFICILSGVFSAMLNFAFVFGEEMRQVSLRAGASTAMSGNAVWALAVSAGFLANAGYCVYLLNRNHTWNVYWEKSGGAAYTLGGTLMGLLWYSGVVVYGMGADALGSLGKIVGWPVFMSIDILTGILWGFFSGEWKGASRTARAYCLAGILVLFLAIGVISWGNAT